MPFKVGDRVRVINYGSIAWAHGSMIKTTKKGLSAIVQMLPGLIDEAAAEYNAQPLQAIPEFTISLKSKVAPSKLMQVTSSADIEKAARAVFNADSIDWVESMLIFALSRANKIQGFYEQGFVQYGN